MPPISPNANDIRDDDRSQEDSLPCAKPPVRKVHRRSDADAKTVEIMGIVFPHILSLSKVIKGLNLSKRAFRDTVQSPEGECWYWKTTYYLAAHVGVAYMLDSWRKILPKTSFLYLNNLTAWLEKLTATTTTTTTDKRTPTIRIATQRGRLHNHRQGCQSVCVRGSNMFWFLFGIGSQWFCGQTKSA